jgi:hypothetical protein
MSEKVGLAGLGPPVYGDHAFPHGRVKARHGRMEGWEMEIRIKKVTRTNWMSHVKKGKRTRIVESVSARKWGGNGTRKKLCAMDHGCGNHSHHRSCFYEELGPKNLMSCRPS